MRHSFTLLFSTEFLFLETVTAKNAFKTHTSTSSSARQVVSLSTVDDSLNEHANHRHALERGDLLLIIRFLSLFATRFQWIRFKKLAQRQEERKNWSQSKMLRKQKIGSKTWQLFMKVRRKEVFFDGSMLATSVQLQLNFCNFSFQKRRSQFKSSTLSKLNTVMNLRLNYNLLWN